MRLLEELIEKLQWLPGIGRKSALRLAFYLQKMDEAKVKELAGTIVRARTSLKECIICHNLTETNPCPICTDKSRVQDRICVVEQPSDVMIIERIGEYRGLYHILHGVISPINNMGPKDLRIDSLLKRVSQNKIDEVIIATNPTTDGDITAVYIAKLLKPLNIKITRIARGLPTGSDIEFADKITIAKALEGRQEI